MQYSGCDISPRLAGEKKKIPPYDCRNCGAEGGPQFEWITVALHWQHLVGWEGSGRSLRDAQTTDMRKDQLFRTRVGSSAPRLTLRRRGSVPLLTFLAPEMTVSPHSGATGQVELGGRFCGPFSIDAPTMLFRSCCVIILRSLRKKRKVYFSDANVKMPATLHQECL